MYCIGSRPFMRWLAALCGLTMITAGCIGGSDDGPGDVLAPDHSEDGNETTDPVVNVTNMAPVAELLANVTVGTAPLAVNFTIVADDDDGDNLTWTLQVGNDTVAGDAVPAYALYVFEAGNHTAWLNVTDGTDVTSVSLAINVTAPEAGPVDPCAGEDRCIIGEDLWAEFWSDGVCDAKGAVGSSSAGWIHDRPGAALFIVGTGNPAGGNWPYGTGFVTGGGTWVYEESNGMPGLQLGGPGPHPVLGTDSRYDHCVNHDQMLF